MTTTDTRPRPAAAPPPPPPRAPRFGLSLTQLVAAGFAAVTATFVASYLGVSGTIIGAAVVSVASAIGNAVYGTSLRHTGYRVRTAVPRRRTPGASPPAPGEPEAGPPPLPAAGPRERPRVSRAWKHVALTAVAVFAALLAVVTAVELAAGRPVSDLVRGRSGTGTSLLGGTPRAAGPHPAPTVTRTVAPNEVVTTPTVTQTAPATTTTTPTETAAPPSSASSDPASGAATSSAAPTAAPPASPTAP